MSDVTERRRTPLWVILLLIVSLSANAFVGGLWGKRFFTERTAEDRALHWIERTAERMPPPARAAYMARFEARRGEFLDRAEAAFGSRELVNAAMGMKPYDPAAVREAQRTARQNFVAMRELMDEVLAETIDDLPPEVRARMAERRDRR